MTDLHPGRRPKESHEHYRKRRRAAVNRVREYLHPQRGGRMLWCSVRVAKVGVGGPPMRQSMRGTYVRRQHGYLGDKP